MSQFVHLLTNSGVGLPTDLWVPSTARIKPQSSRQYALGAAGTWNDFEVSIEGYYKDMHNVIEYKDGASYLSTNQNWQNKVEVGRRVTVTAPNSLFRKRSGSLMAGSDILYRGPIGSSIISIMAHGIRIASIVVTT